ncbi:MAG: hypothetical protein DVB28_001750 [Verrucomicrobia bacterium]|nr:MAG: hypothetical protein DVB28_001750 [Verrucomicrobiota bacterium]
MSALKHCISWNTKHPPTALSVTMSNDILGDLMVVILSIGSPISKAKNMGF